MINQWIKMFKNIKNDKELNDFIENLKIEDLTLENLQKDYLNYPKISESAIDKYFAENYIGYNLQISNEIRKDISWVDLFLPLCEQSFLELQVIINKCSYIPNSNFLVESIYTYILGTCANLSYRTIISEIHNLKQTNSLKGSSKEERYQYFAEVLCLDISYVIKFYKNYPVLFELLCKKIVYITNYIKEILNNISQDLLILEEKLLKESLSLENIKFDMGDTHAKGKSVCILNFSNTKVLYKPRDSKLDNSIMNFSKELEKSLGITNILKIPISLSIENHSYVEFIEQKECDTEEDVQNYFVNLGKTTAILYLFHSKDYHGENVLASNSQPYLIDNETILHRSELRESRNGLEKILDYISESVYSTGILPFTINSEQSKKSLEVGALNSGEDRISPFLTHKISNRHTENIRVENFYKKMDSLPSSPKFNGKLISCEKYRLFFQSGFLEVCLGILKNKQIVNKLISKYFSNLKIRYIFRNTNIYSQLLETSFHPDLLKNKIDRQVYFLRLFEYLNLNNSIERKMGNHEFKQLLNCDVPLFYSDTIRNSIYDYNFSKIVELDYKTSTIEEIEKRISELSYLDIYRQFKIINMSFLGSNFISVKESV